MRKIREILRLHYEAGLRQREIARAAGRVEKLIAELDRYGLGGFEHSLPQELSGGMAQRAAVVRALESRPHMMFCDEPLSSVDSVIRLSLDTPDSPVSIPECKFRTMSSGRV